MDKPKIIGRVLMDEDATEMTRIVNAFMREYKKRENNSTQKNIDL